MEGSLRHDKINFKKKFDLSGRTIIIIGGLGLIGKSFCDVVAQYGGNVVVVDKNHKGMTAHLKYLRKYNVNCEGYSIDVSKKKEIKSLLNEVLLEFKNVDGLVNAHHVKPDGFFESFEDYDEHTLTKILEVNLKGTILSCQIIGSWMASNNGGSIVNMPSTYSIVAPNQNLYQGNKMGSPAVYSASKGGIRALTKYLAVYWSKNGVRVNDITPHGVWDNHEATFEKKFNDLSPMGRMSFNHEVASGLIYLLSDASSYVTGHNLVIDGGWTVW